MGILKYKYKAHRFVNYIFYIIVFLIGFCIGFFTKEINLSKLISNVLMIQNVSALDKTTLNEDIIYGKFMEAFSDFNINDYPNINCYTNSNDSNSLIICVAIDNETLGNLYLGDIYAESSYLAEINGYSGYNIYRLVLDSNLNINSNDFNNDTNYTIIGWANNYYTWTNFDYNTIIDNSSVLTDVQKEVKKESILDSLGSGFIFLDFISSNLKFNENLFKDNPDFKEVCVDNGKSFAITSTSMSDINSVYDYDFIWFPYNLIGLSKILYDNSVDTNEIHYTYEESTERYFFNTKDKIDSYYENADISSHFNIKGYTNKYSYYGWSAFPFRVYYSESVNQFNIFLIENPTKIYIGNLGSNGSVHGGSGTRLDFDEEIEIERYCFYIKNIYEVTEVNLNEYGDYYGIVITPNGDYEFNTSFNKDNLDVDGYLSLPQNFINRITPTLLIVNNLIYEFYMGLPLMLRLYIITFFVIILVLVFMKLGGFGT